MDNFNHQAFPPELKPADRGGDTKTCPTCGLAFSRPGSCPKSRWAGRINCSTKCRALAQKFAVPDAETLTRDYESAGRSTRRLGQLYGITNVLAHRWLVAAGIALSPSGGQAANPHLVIPDRETLHKLAWIEFLSCAEIAAKYGVHLSAVRRWLTRGGIPVPTICESRSKGRLTRENRDSTVRSAYESGLSTGAIADRYGLSTVAITKVLRRLNVEMRPSGFTGLIYTAGDGTAVRSSYEIRVADWLAGHGIAYQYEPTLPFNAANRADFLANGWFIEVWGVLDDPIYSDRKRRKLEGYREHALPLIQIQAWHFKRAYAKHYEGLLSKCLRPP